MKMHRQSVLVYIISIIIVYCYAFSCDSCGNECANACGTKQFRTCCFNYLRKRSEFKAIRMEADKKLTDCIMFHGKQRLARNESRDKHANLLITCSNLTE